MLSTKQSKQTHSKRWISGIIALLLLASNAKADCPNATLLHVGDTVRDCDRIGLNLEFEKSVREATVQNEYSLKIIDQQKQMISLKDLTIQTTKDQAALWKEEAERTRKKYDEVSGAQSKDFLWGFLGGIAVMALAGWTIGQVSHSSGH